MLQKSRANQAACYLLLALLSLSIYGLGAQARDLWAVHEGRRTMIALGMLAQGDWLVPHLQGEPILSKPPLFYWLQMLTIKLAGAGDGTLRLTSTLAAVAGVLALARLLISLGAFSGAFVAGCVLALSPSYRWMAQTAEPEMLFVSLGVVAMMCFARLIAQGYPALKWELGFYLALAAAMMVKGPLVPATALITVYLWSMLRRRQRKLLRLHPLTGLLIILAPATLWLISLSFMGHPASELFSEMGSHLGEKANHQESFFYYLKNLGAMMFPWSLLGGAVLLALIWRAWRWPRRHGLATAHRLWIWIAANRGHRLLVVLWLAVSFLSISLIASKKDYYILVMLPPLAALLGLIYQDWRDRTRLRVFNPPFNVRKVMNAMAIGATILLAIAILMPSPPYWKATPQEGLPSAKLLLGWAGLWLVGMTACLALATRRHRPGPLFHGAVIWSIVTVVLLTLIQILVLGPALNAKRSMRRVAEQLQTAFPANATLFSVEDHHNLWYCLGRGGTPGLKSSRDIASFVRANPGALGVIRKREADLAQKAGQFKVLHEVAYISSRPEKMLLFRLDEPKPDAAFAKKKKKKRH